MRILLVEDHVALRNDIRQHLISCGFAVDVTCDGEEAEFLGNAGVFDAVILDLGLPKRSGIQVLKNWRRGKNPVPVIVLTARSAWHERVDGIEAGADDYLGKPFHMEELVARVRALIRRSHSRTQGAIDIRGYVLDEKKQSLSRPNGDKLDLTATEFRLLRFFMLNPDSILSKEQLMDHIYDYDTVNDHNVIEVYVRRIRKKIGMTAIKTFRNQGYKLQPEEIC